MTDVGLVGMTLEELELADSMWDVGPSPWDSGLRLSWPDELPPDRRVSEYARRLDVRTAARARLLGLRGMVVGPRSREEVVFILDASRGIGGIYLGHRDLSYWEPSSTRDLRGFEPIDDVGREVLAFVALQIERDHHLGERPRGVWTSPGSVPPRDAHLGHLREFMRRRVVA